MIFFFNDPATTEIYTLSLHDALPICFPSPPCRSAAPRAAPAPRRTSRSAGRGSRRRSAPRRPGAPSRSEEHTSELQSRQYLVCRLLLEKKKTRCHVLGDTPVCFLHLL